MQTFFLPVMRLIMAPMLFAAGAFFIQASALSAQAPLAAISQHQSQSVSEKNQQPDIPVAKDGSLNWAGYTAQSARSYSAVSGSWVVPQVRSLHGSEADATWIGIGGVSSRDLIQAGTQALVDRRGNLSYEAWYELLPDYSHTVSLSVYPGDLIHASLMLVGPDTWLISISDATTGQQFSQKVSYHSSQSSAEWIEEMVSNGDYTFRPLDNFGSIGFTDGTTIADGQAQTIKSSGAQPLDMVNDAGAMLAEVSALGPSGSSFTVARSDAPVAATDSAISLYVDLLYQHSGTLPFYGRRGRGQWRAFPQK